MGGGAGGGGVAGNSGGGAGGGSGNEGDSGSDSGSGGEATQVNIHGVNGYAVVNSQWGGSASEIDACLICLCPKTNLVWKD